MDYLTEKYVLFVSSRLRNFKRKSSGVWNFSCPICGDSKKVKSKARGYLFEKSGQVWFVCHNCNAPVGTFENFLKKIDYGLFSEYFIEKMGGERRKEPDVFECMETKPFRVERKANPLQGAVPLSELDPFDIMRTYVVQRRIPKEHFGRLYACQKFKAFTNRLIPDKFNEKSLAYDDYRLLIPFFDEAGEMFAYAGRSIDANSQLRYINIVLDESKPKLFGLDRWSKKDYTYVVEGPIDSLFLPNAIATAGGSLISDLGDYKDNAVIVYDNEPNSKTTKQKMSRAIADGFAVCIWPSDFRYKDINKMVLAGFAPAKIEDVIKSNTYVGLEAEVKLHLWGM